MYDSCLVYLDDVIVIGHTFQGHVLNLRKVFERLREARLKLNPGKCQLLQKEVRYLGHIVSPEGISTYPEKFKAVGEWPTPKDKHEIRSFLGLCMYYRRFISAFANIAKPLTRLTEEKQAFQWTPEVEAAFQTLKGALCAAPLLAYHQQGERFIVDTDASNFGIGGVLSQIQDGQECAIAYYSKTLNKAEKLLRHPMGTSCHGKDTETFPHVPVWTAVPLSHRPLCVNMAHEFSEPGRTNHALVQRLQEYNFTSKHRQGRKHNNADVL
jgi:hypothetical protein